MKFSHLADVHVGAWRDPSMKEMTMSSFRQAVDITIQKNADFCIIAGDLFNTAIPAIDHLQETVLLLKKLKLASIPVYVVSGSHDTNASGKSIIDVLEEADLLVNVMKGDIIDGKLNLKFTLDKKTGVKLTGIGGKRGSLEQTDYAALDIEALERESGKKIFIFHTSIDELKPEHMQVMQSISIKEFPKDFEYYAGGHVHVVQNATVDGRKNICYPGPIFPASFPELWSLGNGGIYFYDDGKIEHLKLSSKKIIKINLDANDKLPEQVSHELESKIKQIESQTKDAIVMIRAQGILKTGRTTDISLKQAASQLYAYGAFFVMRNTSKLASPETTSADAIRAGSASDIEEEAINSAKSSHIFGNSTPEVMRSLLSSLSDEQKDGEKKYEYDARIKKDAHKIFGIESQHTQA